MTGEGLKKESLPLSWVVPPWLCRLRLHGEAVDMVPTRTEEPRSKEWYRNLLLVPLACSEKTFGLPAQPST